MKIARSFTRSRRRPEEIGNLQGLSLPWTFTVAQVGVFAGCIIFGLFLATAGVSAWVLVPLAGIGLVAGRLIRRVRIDDRSLTAGVGGWVRWWFARSGEKRLTQRSADVISSNAVVGADHSVWLVFEAVSVPYSGLADVDGLRRSVARVAGLVESFGGQAWKLMGTVEPVSYQTVATQIADASQAQTWDLEVQAERDRLAKVPMTRRRFWVWIKIDDAKPDSEAGRFERLAGMFNMNTPARASWVDVNHVNDVVEAVIARSAATVKLEAATVAQIQKLLDRVPAGNAEPFLSSSFDAADYAHQQSQTRAGAVRVGGSGVLEGASVWRAGDAEWSQPHRNLAVADHWPHRTAHMSVMLSGLPDSWEVPGGGELLWRLDSLTESWDWVICSKVVPHQLATAKTRNQHRRLNAQLEQYSGDSAGVPPDLVNALALVDEQRQSLAAQPNSDEFEVSIVLSSSVNVADGDTDCGEAVKVLEERVARLTGLAQSVGVTVAVPTGDQLAARRVWLPSDFAGALHRDYRQYLLADGVAGLGPCLQSELGDPQGALLGMADDVGRFAPVLIDPTLGPRAHEINASPKSPSIGIVGRLGSGKSVFSKRLMWTALTMGGKVVVIDRSTTGEYVVFANALAAEMKSQVGVEVIDVTNPNGVSIDPMRCGLSMKLAAEATGRVVGFAGDLDARSSVTTTLSLLASEQPNMPVAHLIAQGFDRATTDVDREAWRKLRDLVAVLAADSVGGTMFDSQRRPANLSADLIVLWAPGLSLTQSADSPSDIAASAVVFGAIALARALIFADPGRFAALLVDEAWSLFNDTRAKALLSEVLRDGRKHQCALWAASQSPTDFEAITEMAELLGHVAVFALENERAAQSAARLAGLDADVVAPVLTSLPTGVCLWKDVAGRSGLVDVWLPANPAAQIAIDSTPTAVGAVNGESV